MTKLMQIKILCFRRFQVIKNSKFILFYFLLSTYTFQASTLVYSINDGFDVSILNEKSSSTFTTQQFEVKGTVVDSKGTPIVGATLVEKGTKNGAITDFDGNFTLSVQNENAILTISFLGYKEMSIALSGKSVINVVLQENISQLDEVVVIGYGSQKRNEITGSVSTVSLKDSEDRAVTDASQLLQGKVSGVTIVQNSGQPGDNTSSIRIRGITSIDNNNDPLIIIDGVPGDMSDVNPNDIKSLSVLKDAASASIYGSRASAGVIIIETKNNTTGLTIDYNRLSTLTQATILPETVNSWEHVTLRNEARRNMNLPEVYSETDIKEFEYGLNPNRPNTDWYDTYFKVSMLHSDYLNIRGGSEKYKFSSSLSHLNHEGVLIGTNSQKLSFRTILDGKFLDDKIRVNLNIYGDEEDSHELSSSTSSVLNQISSNTPVSFVTSDNGTPSFPGRYLYIENIGGGTDRERVSLRLQGSIEIEPIKNVTAKLLYSKNKYELDYIRLLPEYETAGIVDNSFGGSLKLSSLSKEWYQTDTDQFTGTINYDFNIDNHKIGALVGYERLERDYTYDSGFVDDLSTNEPIFSFGNPSSSFLRSGANSNATVSQFGRLNYSYNNKYLVTMSVRRDGSSRFADGNKYGTFPSASLGWVMDKENFMKNSDFLKLKLRASWGRLGNQNISTTYATSDQMSGSEFYAFGGAIVPGRGTTVLANPDTTWETTEQIDIGFNMIINNHVTINFDYYQKKTFDILARVTIPPSLGVSSLPYQNVGDMLNEGFDLDLGYKSKSNPNGFGFSINANLSYLKNEVTSLGDNLEFVNHSSANILRSQVGSSFSSFFGYKTNGLLQINDFTWQNNSDITIPHDDRDYQLISGLPDHSGVMTNPAPGDIKMVDTNEDNLITPDDKTIIGRSVPKINYGINLNFSYKNWNLRLLGQGVGGSQAYLNGPGIGPFWNAGNGTVSRVLADNRWTFENQNTSYSRLYEDKIRDAIVSDYNIYDADYFRLKNITLSYDINKNILDKIGISRLKIFATAENVFVITNFLEGYDPERDYRNTSGNFHPQTSSYSLGINLSL
ncbi:MAG: TonB-dependent receptor [Gelidibacter sp.]|nr:TonB-dependent receptor [Gelidibacter sp.]